MTSISGFLPILERAYDFQAIGQSADLVNVMTYDYHGFWDKEAHHHSPLKTKLGENEQESAVRFSKLIFPQIGLIDNTVISLQEYVLNYVSQQGIPKQKLQMGIALYGQSVVLSSIDNQVGAPIVQGKPASPGPHTIQAGMLAYHEICSGSKT